MDSQIGIFENGAGLAQALAAAIQAAARQAIAARGSFQLALSGGTALASLAEGLRALPAGTLAWERWHVFWADERCVPSGSPESNAGAAHANGLRHVPVPSGQIHAVNGAWGPDAAARDYEDRLKKAFCLKPGGWPRFDVILLGVGADGHTASLFPGDPALDETRRLVAPVRQAPKPPPERVTLTLPVINNARQVFFVATGAGKASVIGRILSAAPAGAWLPAQRVRPVDGEVRWFLDRAAGANLKERGEA